MNRLQSLATNALRMIRQNSPTILSATAVAGVATTSFLAVRATFQAADKIYAEEFNLKENEDGTVTIERVAQMTFAEKLKLVAHLYIPAAAMGGLTMTSVIMANTISSRRTAAFMSLYSLSDTALREYQDKTIEQIGEKKEQAIVDAIAQDHINADPPTLDDVILVDGKVLVRDDWSGRYFQSTVETIRSVQNDLNEALVSGDGFVSLNDFYIGLNLKPTEGGNRVGWSSENKVNVSFSTGWAGEEERGVPCLVIGFRAKPVQDYDSSH